MRLERLAREADTHDRATVACLLQEAQRYHRPMIERRRPLPERPRRQPRRLRAARKLPHERLIIARANAQLRRAERGEITGRRRAGRDMEIIRIKHGVRARHDDDIRRLTHHPGRCLAAGIDCRLDPLLLTTANLRHDERRMRKNTSP